MPRAGKPTKAELQLRAQTDKLTTTIVCLRAELENKTGACRRLEILLGEPLAKVDELNGKLEQARAQNRLLDQECERLVEIRLPPPSIAS